VTIAAGDIPDAAELDSLGGRLVAGWATTLPATSCTTSEADLWSVTFVPEVTGTYRFESSTPADGTAGEEAKYRLYVDSTERRNVIGRMPAGSFVTTIPLVAVVDLTAAVSMTVKVTGIRTSGSNTIQCRLTARQLYIYKVERSASGLISA